VGHRDKPSAMSSGAARDGRILDRLDKDTVLGEQEIAHFLALIQIAHHYRHNVRLTGRYRKTSALRTDVTRAGDPG
jgi:hypothetical protein